jgi:hypothetical protein
MTELRLQFVEDMKLRGLSENTRKTYVDMLAAMARYFARSPARFSDTDLRKYLVSRYARTGRHLLSVR